MYHLYTAQFNIKCYFNLLADRLYSCS